MFVKKGSGFKGKAKVTLVVVAGNEELVSTYLKTADFEWLCCRQHMHNPHYIFMYLNSYTIGYIVDTKS